MDINPQTTELFMSKISARSIRPRDIYVMLYEYRTDVMALGATQEEAYDLCLLILCTLFIVPGINTRLVKAFIAQEYGESIKRLRNGYTPIIQEGELMSDFRATRDTIIESFIDYLMSRYDDLPEDVRVAVRTTRATLTLLTRWIDEDEEQEV